MLSLDEELELLKLYEAEDQSKIDAWYRGDLYHKLHSGQKLIYDTVRYLPKTVRDCIFYCARRFGKSFLIVIMALEDCIRNPKEVIRIVGPELEQTIEIVEFNLDKIIVDAPPGFIKKLTRKSWRVGNSKLIVGAFDNRNVRKNLGKEAFAIYTEEAANAKSDEFAYGMKEILSPQLLHSKGRFYHGTTPPPELDHIFETEYVPAASKAGTLFRFTIDDNPRADAEMREQAIKDSGGIDTIAYKRNYLVQAVKDPGIVVTPAFNQARHVKPIVIPEYATWIIFGDWGGVRDRTWVGAGFWDYLRGKLCVVAEIDYDPNTESGRVAADIRNSLETLIPKMHNPRLILKAQNDDGLDHWPRWIDCAGQTKVDLLSKHGLLVQLPFKDNFDAAANNLNMGFVNDQIEIDPSCTQLIATCEFGRFNKQRTDFARSVALGHMDAIAGLMYGYRMVDKTTNPYPPEKFDRQEYYVPPQDESEVSLREFGQKLKIF